MFRLITPALLLLLAACTGVPSLQTGWPAHPEDAAWMEASVDRRLGESLSSIAHLSLLLAMADADPVSIRVAADASTDAAAAFRAIAAARVATAGTEAGRAALFAASAAACHESVARVALQIAAHDSSAADALRLAQLTCLSSQTMRLVG